MTKSPIELLVLDGQGVVFSNPFLPYLDHLAKETGQSVEDVRKRWRDELRVPFWTGQLREEDVWRKLTAGKNGQPWRHDLESRYDLGPAAAHLERWSQRLPVWMLSNHRSDWLVPRIDRFGLTRYFERVVVSDDTGSAKPDPSAFDAVLARYKDPSAVLFVDDRLRNIETAARLGMQAILADKKGSWVEIVERETLP